MLSRSFLDVVVRVLCMLVAISPACSSRSFAGGHKTNLLDELLAIEQSHRSLCNSALDAESARQRITALAAEFREQLEASSGASADSKVQMPNGIIFGPGGIRSSQDLHDPCNLLLSGVLARGQGYCVGVAAVYLAVAEELNLPVYAVGTPSHVFLRYDDGTTRINIETDGGRSVPDQQYISQNRISPVSVQKGVFLEDLTNDRFLAQVHNNLGVIYSERREFERAAAEYKKALRLDKRLPAAWYNSGKDFQEQGRLKDATAAFSKALKLHPNDTWALNNRGMAYRQLQDLAKARRDLEEALRIDPGFEQAKTNLLSLLKPN